MEKCRAWELWSALVEYCLAQGPRACGPPARAAWVVAGRLGRHRAGLPKRGARGYGPGAKGPGPGGLDAIAGARLPTDGPCVRGPAGLGNRQATVQTAVYEYFLQTAGGPGGPKRDPHRLSEIGVPGPQFHNPWVVKKIALSECIRSKRGSNFNNPRGPRTQISQPMGCEKNRTVRVRTVQKRVRF